ncbi:hypothetical protein UFOVP330_32 [uncultured Caudovirales phage]|jgi:hypothetical protein|uniref:Uncharacterized protein n=1 Tax=uncultured Caudovirales phage TaxID=2100421 RepID=A0A6J5LZ92_9CAUD|nr:hypothetical protein UFOVP330_32 [uncultured Caudovirales phage]
MSEKVVGVQDMHPAQIAELMNFCCYALDLAETLAELLGDPEVADEATSKVESLTEMFGANTLILRTSLESPDSEQESD